MMTIYSEYIQKQKQFDALASLEGNNNIKLMQLDRKLIEIQEQILIQAN